ncbi:sensor histidine kinase [Autumnicola psychrophila]|uniref:histidine kinase n=1 Tax=Autumnicola psychrophila TaxID=3075592 RepID=A0ABU3DSC6_9FLAO|nr:ATP-binding protein [Zunongwangia sp. F225]MDT0686626.1 histidine kinase [Zunongwangia sp. F225]
MLSKEEILLIIYFVLVILLLTAFVIIFFITYQRRKNKLLEEKFEAEKRYEQEIVQSRIEIQEQTLKNVSWELHDNIGQLLSVANLQLNILSKTLPEKEEVLEIKEVVAASLQEVRALSKSLNNEVVEYAGLMASVENELNRFERLNILQVEFKIEGEKFEIDKKDEIILFRILQEFFSNVIKHAKAPNLMVKFSYLPDNLKIEVQDDGIGFNPEEVNKSSGLLNMKSRAALIKTDFRLSSSENKGTFLSLSYPSNPGKNE